MTVGRLPNMTGEGGYIIELSWCLLARAAMLKFDNIRF
jgi:hypothetical protein